MSHRGTTLVVVNPYGLGVGPLARTRLSGLGDDVSYGTDARRAALDRARRESLQRAYDEADSAKRAQERKDALEITQEAFDKASKTQRNILTVSQSNMRVLMLAAGVLGIASLGAVTLTALVKKDGGRRSWKKRSSKKPSYTGAFA